MQEASGVNASVYVDDSGATAAKPSLLNQALQVSMEYISLTVQALNAAKCKVFTTVTRQMH